MRELRLLRPADLALGVPGPTVTVGGEVGGVLSLLDLDGPLDDEVAATAARALEDRAQVVVGVARSPLSAAAARLAPALDLTLLARNLPSPVWGAGVPDLDAALALLATAVAQRPRAALVVAALLRQTALLPVPEGLAAEAAAYSTLLAGGEYAAWLAARGPARPTRAGDEQRVRLTRVGTGQGDVLQVRLVRTARRNAFDAAMRGALVEAFDVALADPALAVHLSGAGPVFSSGGDLDEFGSAAEPATAWVVRVTDAPGRSLARLGARCTAWVHGPCAGAGVELPAFAGTVVADPATTFRLPELAMGLLPGAGGTVSLTRRIGRWRTAWLALTGLALDAQTALAWGLVDRLEPRADQE